MITTTEIAPQSHNAPVLIDEFSVQNANTNPAYDSIVPGITGKTAPKIPTTPQITAAMAKNVSTLAIITS